MQTKQNQTKDAVRTSIILKIISIGFLVLVLLIPSVMIIGLVDERESTRTVAEKEVGDKWGRQQTIGGPVLTIPYRVFKADTSKKVRSVIRYAHFLPENLTIEGEIKPEIRYRGIYEVVLYHADLNFTGNFLPPAFREWNISPDRVLWDRAYFSLGIPDPRGITESIALTWEKEQTEFEPGLRDFRVFKSGASVLCDTTGGVREGGKYSFHLSINGSGPLFFLPVGKQTLVTLKSDWTNPSFSGSFLPATREIGDSGFKAHWKVLDLNRNFPQQWRASEHNIREAGFGVTLFQPVDTYQKTMRSAKYAVLFVILTFLAFFLIEVLNRLRLHPVQYLLVGFAIVLFYLLLLSLSEHIPFGFSYLVGAAGVVLLISTYIASVFRNGAVTSITAGLLVLLYGWLYVLLQLEDYALLIGSLGLFFILALVMYLTRRIDWYRIGSNAGKEANGRIGESE